MKKDMIKAMRQSTKGQVRSRWQSRLGALVLGATVCTGMLLPVAGCKSVYYNTWEKLGWEKRDILVDRVEDARDEQQKAKEQFKTTLQRFQELTNFNGGELESKYKKLSSAYDDCASRAAAVTKRINDVDTVANDMFKEWKAELKEYQNQDLRRVSEKKLTDTQARYRQLLEVMRNSESKMKPVLAAFHDQVLSLKHSLNAEAINSLQSTSAGIESDVQALVKEMEASINEANDFITQMQQAK